MASAPSAAARLGVGLGWFSLAVGLAGLIRPAAIARYAGLPPAAPAASASSRSPAASAASTAFPSRAVRAIRAIGIRELANGAGILLRPHKPGWLWLRVAGGALDLALLGLAARARHTRQRNPRTNLAAAAVAGVTVLDTLAAIKQGRIKRPVAQESAGAIRVRRSININRSPEACYRFWRDIDNFPRFMQHVDEIRVLDATRSHWKVRTPQGGQVEWTAELSSDVPAQQLGWRTLPNAGLYHAGVVRFLPAPGSRGTRVEVDFSYRAPLGKTDRRMATLLGDEPSQQVDEDLRRFKQLIETGEIPTTVGQPSGKRSLVGRLLHRGAPG